MAAKMTESAATPGHEDHVLALCHMLSNRIGKAFVPALAEFGLTVAEWRVILTLAFHKNASGQEITGRWAMDKMAVNRAVASLRRRGLVRKSRNKQDRRNIDLSLTPSGHVLCEKMLPAANQRYHLLLACLDQREVKLFRQLVTKMIGHADSITA